MRYPDKVEIVAEPTAVTTAKVFTLGATNNAPSGIIVSKEDIQMLSHLKDLYQFAIIFRGHKGEALLKILRDRSETTVEEVAEDLGISRSRAYQILILLLTKKYLSRWKDADSNKHFYDISTESKKKIVSLVNVLTTFTKEIKQQK